MDFIKTTRKRSHNLKWLLNNFWLLIVECEAELESNPIAKLLTLSPEEQIKQLSNLSPEEQVLFFEMRKRAEENKELEDKINKTKAL